MTAVYAEASGPGTIEWADALGRTPKRRRHRPVRDEWSDGIRQRVPLLPQQVVPCDSQGDPNKWATDQVPRYNASLCADCPCVVNCLAYALKWDVAGTWGGTSRPERGAIRIRAGLPAPLPITLGTSPNGGAHPSWSRTAAPDEDYVSAALGLFDDLEISRDEATAVAAVDAVDAPQGDLGGAVILFATTCANCRLAGDYAEVLPERVIRSRESPLALPLALYTCNHCGYSWAQPWKSADDALTTLMRDREAHYRAERKRREKAKERIIAEHLGMPVAAVVTSLGAWIAGLKLDENGCVTHLELREGVPAA